MHVVFMETPDFSVSTLETLVEAGHDVATVVTQPDKPKGREKEIQMTPVKIQALEYKIPVHQPMKVRDKSFVEVLQKTETDVSVVIAFGQILPESILDLPRFRCMNIHASLLPKYRGAMPIQWCVIDGEEETSMTTMMMDVGLDTDDMLERVVIPIDRDEMGGSLHDKLSLAGGELILSTLKKMEEETTVRTPQTEGETCYARMLTESLGDIDWERSAVPIERLIRKLNLWPSAYTVWNEKSIKMWSANVLREDKEEEIAHSVPSLDNAPSDTVAYSGKRSLMVKTGKGLLSTKELQMEGEKRMDVDTFLRGYPVHEGDILTRKTE